MRYFETRFLQEAEEFISRQEQKTVRKIIYNIDLAEQTNDPKLFKNFKTKFGNFVLIMQVFKSGYLHFGISRTTKKH